MQNLNQAIKFLLLISIVLCCIKQNGLCQSAQPQEFQNLPITSRALTKSTMIVIDNNTRQNSQNIALDKTGFILHIIPKSKDQSSKIKIISEDGKEVEIFDFTDGSIFALVDSEETYSIIQETKPNCTLLAKAFVFNETDTICPEKEEFKLLENIMISNDTDIAADLKTPSELYTVTLSLPEVNIFDETFKYVQISNEEEQAGNLNIEESQPDIINTANLLKSGKICIVGALKSKSKPNIKTCTFENKNIQSIITYAGDFKNKIIQNNNPNLVFSFLPATFSKLRHEAVFGIESTVKSSETEKEIDKKSKEKLFLENYTSDTNLNLGLISTQRTRRKNIITLSSPIQFDKTLRKTKFNIPINQLEAIINPFSDKSNNSVLANIKISGKGDKSPDSFNISASNNVVIKNLAEPPEEEKKPRLLFQQEDIKQLKISTYIPDNIFGVTLSTLYSFVEQNISPSVDENGKSKDIINNKSKEDLILIKDFGNIDFSKIQSNINLKIEKASKLLNNDLFNNQFTLSGFLIPPDSSPVVQPPYRATIELFMSIKLTNTDSVNILFSDIKTKDEVPSINFFKFSFLPSGTYETKVKFDGDRTKLFQAAGVIKK